MSAVQNQDSGTDPGSRYNGEPPIPDCSCNCFEKKAALLEQARWACRLAREALDACNAKAGAQELKKQAYVALAKVLGG